MVKKKTANLIEKIKNNKRPFYKRWYFWVIISLALFVCFGGNDRLENIYDEDKVTTQKKVEEEPEEEPEEESTEDQKEDTKEEHKEEAKTSGGIDNTGIEEGDVEYACQDAKYYINSTYYQKNVKSLINVWEYNEYYTRIATAKDGDKPIIQFTWNGVDKDGGKISFVCYIMKNDNGELIPIQIKSSSHDIWKTDADFMAIIKQ